MSNNEKVVREIVSTLQTYRKNVQEYSRRVENIHALGLGNDEEARDIARVEVERDMYIETAKPSILNAMNALVQKESDKEAARKAAEKTDAKLQSPVYHAALANAMKMIESLGKDMTAEQLQSVIDPYVAALDYRTLDILRSLAQKQAPQLFALGSSVDFGSLPGDELQFLQKLQPLIPRAFEDSLSGSTAIGYICAMVNDHYGVPTDEK